MSIYSFKLNNTHPFTLNEIVICTHQQHAHEHTHKHYIEMLINMRRAQSSTCVFCNSKQYSIVVCPGYPSIIVSQLFLIEMFKKYCK